MKKIYLTASLLLMATLSFAQETKKDTLKDSPTAAAFTTDQSEALRNFQPKVVKASPEATAFYQITQMPVNYYTGKSQVAVPLLSLESRKMALSLSLNYDPSGIKVEQEATQVGLGWSLVGGMGMITRVVKGRDDFDGMFRTGLKQQNTLNKYRANSFDISPAAGNVKWQYDNFLIQYGTSGQNLQTQLSLFCTTSTDSVYILSTMLLPDIFGGALESGKPFLDGESDIYNYQAGKYSGRFIFQPQGTGFQVVTLDQSPVKIELMPNVGMGLPDYTGESGFKITTPDGMKYYYQINEKAKTRGGESATGKLVYVESNINDDPVYAASSVNWDVINVDAAIPQITGWYLTKMESPDDATDFIQLNYTQDATYSAITLPNRIQNLVVNSAKWRLSDTRQKLVNLTSITSPKGSITFKRSSRLDLRGTMATKIDTIILKDQFNRTVSRFKFNYGYFDSGTTAEEFVKKRLKLTSLEQLANDGLSKIPTHTFSYIEQASDGTQIPNKNSYMQDFWGLFNHATNNDVAVNAAYGLGSGSINAALKGTMIPANLPSYATTWGFTDPANRNANLDYCQIGALSSITFPTGGVTSFVYEMHNFQNYLVDALPNSITVSNNSSQNTTKIYGVGLRIAQSRLYETATSTNYLLKRYEYTQEDSTSSSGKLMFDLKFSQIINNGTGNPHLMFTSSPVYPNNNSANGNPIGYDRVTEREVNPANSTTNGKIVYEFINKVEQRKDRFCLQFKSDGSPYNCNDSAPPATFGTCTGYTLQLNGGAIFYNQAIYENASIPNYTHLDNGMMKTKTVFHQNYAKVTSEENVYGTITSTERIRVKNLSAVGRVVADAYPVLYTYWTDAEWIKLISKTTKQYLVSDNTNFLAQTETYTYNALNHLVNTTTTIDSKNETLVSTTTFANDLASGTNIYQKMVNLNKLEIPIQQVTNNITKGVEVQKLVYGFKEFLTNQILPETIQRYIGGQNPNRNEVVSDYDALANVIKITPIQAPEQRFIWGYGGNYPIAEVKNAGNEKIFYTSFEENTTGSLGNWQVTSAQRTQNNAHTGTQFYNLSSGFVESGTANALNASTIYTLSYWSNGSAYAVNGNSTPTKTGLTVSGWTYYEHTVTGVSNVQIQGSGGIDELRMYPKKAFMSSFTENPMVGLSSSSDVNGYKMSYQFDVFQRLKSIKDPQDFVLKDLNYHYANQTALTGLGVTPTNALNYIISRTAREAQTGTTLDSDVDKTQTQIQYSDGLGRGLEGILWKGSPDKTKDIVTGLSLFDAFGRGYKQTLPTPSDANTGAYKSTAESLANTFYADTAAHTRIVFEPSPLNRTDKQYGAGQAWRVADKYVKMQYLLAGLGITLFDIQSNGTVNCNTSYTASTLMNYCTETERGSQIYELKDKQGRVTHKFQEMDNGFAVTAYCYNSLGFLVVVIPPEAYNKLGPGKILSFTENDVIFKELCFGYHQDKFGRIIEKHIPGAEWTRYVYDKRDRICLERDSKDSTDSPSYWKFTKFDNMNRPIMSGIMTSLGSFTRQILQTAFDGVTNPSEERTTTFDTNLGAFYTNTSFPNATAYTVKEADLRTLVYYDEHNNWQTDVNYNFQSSLAFHAQGFTKGLITGMFVRNLETNAWYKNVNYFDLKSRPIQSFSQNDVGGIDRSEYQYRFNGEVLKMRMVHRKTGAKDLTELYEYSYNHTGVKTSFTHNSLVVAKYEMDGINRLQNKKFRPAGTATGSSQTGNWTDLTTWQSGVLPLANDNVTINTGQIVTIPNGQSGSAGILNDKGTLKNFGTLNMGKIANADLYVESLSYHIRGGLRGKNLDANENLTNSLFSYKLSYEDGTGGYFDGNIRNQYWKSSIDGIKRAFEHSYDKASRLIGTTYASDKAGENYSLNGVSYDFNGNILNLSRNGATNANYTSFNNVDNLTYTYQNNSNKLLKVQDATTGNTDLGDFRDGVNLGDDYEYWLDGSLKKDLNKSISQIQYNYLKLPKRIDFSNGTWISYQYDAGGKKLRKTTSQGVITDYTGNKIYENNVLYQISHDEGRINAQGQYEYNINDHLGNLRLAFRDSSGIAVPTQSLFYDSWGLSTKGMQISRNPANFNHFQYNSKEIDLTTGFTDLGNRMVNPTIGRMLSIDKVSALYAGDSPYGHVLNNPIKYVDIEGNFVIDAETARKYPALAFLVNSVLPNLVNNPEVLQALAFTSIREASTINWGGGKKQDIIEFIKSHLASGSGPNIIVTHPPTNQEPNGPAVNEGDAGHYAGNTTPSERNNIYINRIAVERLENAAKAYLNSGGNGGGNFALETLNISHTITHEFAHFLVNAIWGSFGELNRGQFYEAGNEFSEKTFGNKFYANSSLGKDGLKAYYNKNRNNSILRGMTTGMNTLDLFFNIHNSQSSGSSKPKKKSKGGSALGGANDSN